MARFLPAIAPTMTTGLDLTHYEDVGGFLDKATAPGAAAIKECGVFYDTRITAQAGRRDEVVAGLRKVADHVETEEEGTCKSSFPSFPLSLNLPFLPFSPPFSGGKGGRGWVALVLRPIPRTFGQHSSSIPHFPPSFLTIRKQKAPPPAPCLRQLTSSPSLPASSSTLPPLFP